MKTINNENNLTEIPLVSIIVITYNSSKYVLETLESAKAQTYKNIELIISDDCSTDDTVAVCKSWLNENKARFVNTKMVTVKENGGIPANCNRGVKEAKGEWIKYIAGDDRLKHNAIQIYLDYIKVNPETKFLHGNMQVFQENMSIKNEVKYFNYKNYLFNQKKTTPQEQFEILLRVNPLLAPTTFIKTNLFLEYGYFEEKFRLWEDRPMWLKLTKNGIKLEYIDHKTVLYRLSDNSVQIKKNKIKIFAEFDILKSGYMMAYNKHLGFIERTFKRVEYKRKLYLDKIGLNKIGLLPRIINFITGFLLIRYIKRVNNNYK